MPRVYYMCMPPTENKPPVVQNHEGAGPIIGAIIVVILLVFGALYFWGQKLNKEQSADTPILKAGAEL